MATLWQLITFVLGILTVCFTYLLLNYFGGSFIDAAGPSLSTMGMSELSAGQFELIGLVIQWFPFIAGICVVCVGTIIEGMQRST